MADTAAHLVDRVLSEVAVRQWALSLPFALRYRLAYDARLTSDVLGLFVRAVFASLRRRAWRKWGVRRGQCGAVTFVQRFGSALNLNVHFHTLVLDGVYPITEAGPSRFHPLPPPGHGEVASVVAATGPRAGQRLLRLGDRVEPDDREYLEVEPPRRCASAGGLSLQADVAVPTRDRRRLERLCGYVARPPLATERLTQVDDGRLCYRLKRRWRDGTTHLLLERVALLERLAALVPPPRFHLVRYHGIFAPCASWRDHVVPAGAGPLIPQTSRTARTSKGPADTKPGATVRARVRRSAEIPEQRRLPAG
jgi:hypothetical protein